MTLLPCPCGKTPKKLIIKRVSLRVGWAMAYPDCCEMWRVPFILPPSPEMDMIAAIDAWNGMPRTEYPENHFGIMEAKPEEKTE